MNNRRTKNRGFTLIELLLVVAILGVLASLAVGVMAEAQNDAAIAATRSRLTMIRQILEGELEDYEVRRAPVSQQEIATFVSGAVGLGALSSGSDLVHVRNIRRMIMADLIRAEMPDGSRTEFHTDANPGDEMVGRFPTDTLIGYFESLGVTRSDVMNTIAFPIKADVSFVDFDTFESSLPTVDRWRRWQGGNGWGITPDINAADGVEDEAADRSELLFALLTGIDVDGTPANELLGSRAVGDTDGDGIQEVIDAWGEPIFLQWQQEWVRSVGDDVAPDEVQDGVWRREQTLVGLSVEHHSFRAPDYDNAAVPIAQGQAINYYSMPVLPTQIRPFLVSERLLQVDGTPSDYLTGPESWRSVQP